jgi:hypothetical protein
MKTTTFVFPSTPVFVRNCGKPIVQFKQLSAKKVGVKPGHHFLEVVYLEKLLLTKLSLQMEKK